MTEWTRELPVIDGHYEFRLPWEPMPFVVEVAITTFGMVVMRLPEAHDGHWTGPVVTREDWLRGEWGRFCSFSYPQVHQ